MDPLTPTTAGRFSALPGVGIDIFERTVREVRRPPEPRGRPPPGHIPPCSTKTVDFTGTPPGERRSRPEPHTKDGPPRISESLVLLFGALCALGSLDCRRPQTPNERARSSPAKGERRPEKPRDPAGEDETRSKSEAKKEEIERSEPTSSDDTTSRGGPPLSSFFRALQSVEREDEDRVVRIVQIGDSHTASDTLTGRFRELLQRKFGAAGRGYAYPGVPWKHFRQEQMGYASSSNWTTAFGTAEDPDGPFALGGLRVETNDEGAWIERRACDRDESKSNSEKNDCEDGAPFGRFSVHYLVRPEGGSFDVTVDGGDGDRVRTVGESTDLGVYRRDIEPGYHRIRIEAHGDGPVGLFGIRTGSGSNGIEYSSLGINGAKAPEFASLNGDLVKRELEELDPDLVILAFGTNGAFDLHRMHDDPDDDRREIVEELKKYQLAFDRLLRRVRSAAPEASCLLLLPPDTAPPRSDGTCRTRVEIRGEELCIPPNIRHYADILGLQRALAQRHGCATWSQARAMGDAGSIRYWAALKPPLAQSDGVHLTMDGYDLLAEAFFDDLMETYRAWRSKGKAALETDSVDRAFRDDRDAR